MMLLVALAMDSFIMEIIFKFVATFFIHSFIFDVQWIITLEITCRLLRKHTHTHCISPLWMWMGLSAVCTWISSKDYPPCGYHSRVYF